MFIVSAINSTGWKFHDSIIVFVVLDVNPDGKWARKTRYNFQVCRPS